MPRHAVFFDVENTSRAQHIDRVIRHLAIEHRRDTDFIAVGNWRVVSVETARLLSHHGARLLHSAPAVGVKDWSDLWIAVAAGLWLGEARPGDSIDIVSDDRAFDAAGDVAASLGVAFRRLSFRRLADVPGNDGSPSRHRPAVTPSHPAASSGSGTGSAPR